MEMETNPNKMSASIGLMPTPTPSPKLPSPVLRTPATISAAYEQEEPTGITAANMSRIRNELARLDQSLLALEKTNRDKVRGLQNEIKDLKYIIDLNKQEHNAEVERLKNEKSSMLRTLEYLQQNNDKLRTDIVEMGNELNPAYDEDHYIDGFEKIKMKLEMWVASHSVSGVMPKDIVKKIWLDLSNHGLVWRGASTGPLVDPNVFRGWYTDDTARLQLIRSFAGAFLFQHVFQPYIFGMDHAIAESFRLVGDDIVGNSSSLFLTQLTF
jgi:hypothetical protein